MPSKETQDLLDRLKGLKGAADSASATENPRFEDAVDRLDQLTGRGRSSWKASAFEDAVWQVLSTIPGAVVSREPRTPGSQFRPDFLVSVDDHKVLVEAKGRSDVLLDATERLASALDAYRADEALIVLPDGAKVGELPGRGASLKILEMHDLRDFFAGLARS